MSRKATRFLLSLTLSSALVGVWSSSAAAAKLLVTSIFTSSVDLYDTDGTLLQANFIPPFDSLNPGLNGGLVFPANIITGPNGNIYVSSNLTGHVLMYDRNTGAPLGVAADLGASSAPSGLAFDSSGRLYVGDHASNAVQVFDSSSTTVPVQTISIPTIAPLQQGGGIDFAPDGRLFITSFGTSEVYVYDGSTVSLFAGSGAGGLAIPAGIEVGPDGSVYVANIFGNSISKFEADGTPVDGPGGPGTPFITIPLDQFPVPNGIFFPGNAPGDVIFDANGDLLIPLLGPTNPTETPHPLGGLVRYSTSGVLLDTLAYPINSASSLALLEDVEAVPEPTSIAMAVVAVLMGGLFVRCRRR